MPSPGGQARSVVAGASYQPRVVVELDGLLAGLPAAAIEGPKAVGKTATALRRAVTVCPLDDEGERSVAQADLSRLVKGERPILIDEWQRLPESFDRVRRAVDEGAAREAFCSRARRPLPIRPLIRAPAGSCVYGCDR